MRAGFRLSLALCFAAATLLGILAAAFRDPLIGLFTRDPEVAAYARAYAAWFRDHLPEHGLPARFTVHVIDAPDKAASYEFYTTALLQRTPNQKAP